MQTQPSSACTENPAVRQNASFCFGLTAGLLSNSKPQLVVSDRHLSVLVIGLMGCHGAVATLLRARGNVVMGPWQRTVCLTGMEIKGIRLLVCRTETEDDA